MARTDYVCLYTKSLINALSKESGNDLNEEVKSKSDMFYDYLNTVREALKMIGIELEDEKGNIRNLSDVLDDVNNILNDVNKKYKKIPVS